VKKLLFILFILPIIAFGQSESSAFQHYDTIYNSACGPFKLIIHRPISSDTAQRPAIIFMPGQGEQGTTDTTIITRNGPFYWLQHGWDGGVTLGNGKHYPIIISVSATTTVTPYPPCVYEVLNYIVTHYPIKRSSVHLTGLSQGAFSWGAMIKFEQTAGAETGMKLIKSACLLEGTPDPLPSPYSTWDRDTVAYKVWAAKYGGRYFYLEGSGSDNFRDGWHYSLAMNDSVPGSGYFSYENLGGGAHCCWNSMYDPSATNWSCVTPLGPNNAPSQVGKNTMGTYRVGQNLFTWMIAQGDTTLVGGVNCNPTVSAGSNQSITLPINTVNLTGSSSALCGNTISSNVWSELSGPNSATITSPNTLSTSVTGLIQGTYVFKLTTTDNQNNSNNATMQVVVNPATVTYRKYTWPVTNGNINITNANVGFTLKGGDTVYIPPKSGGYRSFSMSGIGTINDTLDIQIIAQGNVFITPSSVNLFANTMDNCNHVRVYGINMSNHADPFLFTYANTAHSHFITFDSLVLIKMPGFNSSSLPSSSTLPNYDGSSTDTVHMFYKWRLTKIFADSSSTQAGLTFFTAGNTAANEMWAFLEVDHCKIGDYTSGAPNPACYLNLTNVYGVKIHDDSCWNIGVLTNPIGHCGMFQFKYCYVDVYNNYFGPSIFGNEARSFGLGQVPALNWLFLREDSLFDGVSRWHNNISRLKRKYPVVEVRPNFGDGTISYYLPRRSLRAYNNTLSRPGVGAGNSYYSASYIDAYGVGVDTIEIKNTLMYGPYTDTVASWPFFGSLGTGGVILTQPSGQVLKIDTSNNISAPTFATTGLSDSILFIPKLNSVLYNGGTNVPSYITKDKYGTPIPTLGRASFGSNSNIDIGAVQLPALPAPPVLNGIRIKTGHKRKFIRI